jgi:Xaa-Pro aminopeptidase
MRELMQREALDALVLATADFRFFATNLEPDVLPWERPVVVVVPKAGAVFGLLNELSERHLEIATARGTTWLDDVTFYAEHPRVDGRLALAPDWSRCLARLLHEHGLGAGSIGTDVAAGPVHDAVALLPRAAIRHVDLELRELRLVKHPEELALARAAGSLSDWAQERYREELYPGRLLDELDWSIGAMIMEEAAQRHPGECVRARLMSLSGPDSAAPHGAGAGTGARVERGHGVVNIIVLRLNGMTVENERTWFCGPPGSEQARAFAAVARAQEAAIDQARTGRPVAAIDAAAQRVLEDAGYGAFICHRTGHGVGIGRGAAITAHDFPHDVAFATRPLRAGEVYSVEPGIYLPGIGGFRHDDTVIIGDEPEVVTHAPRDLESQTVGRVPEAVLDPLAT